MRRPLWNRTVAAVFAVWVALALGDAGFAHHRCPMHDGPVPPAAAGTSAHHGAHGANSGHDGPQQRAHHLCTCIGACTASSGAMALVAPVELPAAVVGFVSAPALDPNEILAPAQRAPFTLPYANGPPQRVA